MDANATETGKADDIVRVNLKLRRQSHTKIRMWCLKKGYTLQDGLSAVVETVLAKMKDGELDI